MWTMHRCADWLDFITISKGEININEVIYLKITITFQHSSHNLGAFTSYYCFHAAGMQRNWSNHYILTVGILHAQGERTCRIFLRLKIRNAFLHVIYPPSFIWAKSNKPMCRCAHSIGCNLYCNYFPILLPQYYVGYPSMCRFNKGHCT